MIVARNCGRICRQVPPCCSQLLCVVPYEVTRAQQFFEREGLAQSTYNAALTLALILLVMVFVLVLFGLAGRLERRLLHWRHA